MPSLDSSRSQPPARPAKAPRPLQIGRPQDRRAAAACWRKAVSGDTCRWREKKRATNGPAGSWSRPLLQPQIVMEQGANPYRGRMRAGGRLRRLAPPAAIDGCGGCAAARPSASDTTKRRAATGPGEMCAGSPAPAYWPLTRAHTLFLSLVISGRAKESGVPHVEGRMCCLSAIPAAQSGAAGAHNYRTSNPHSGLVIHWSRCNFVT